MVKDGWAYTEDEDTWCLWHNGYIAAEIEPNPDGQYDWEQRFYPESRVVLCGITPDAQTAKDFIDQIACAYCTRCDGGYDIVRIISANKPDLRKN